jgi:RNA polymerase sigma factor (sigma-70 family)
MSKSRTGRHSLSPTDKLVTDNLRLVPFVAQRFIGRGVDLDELVAAGNEALVKAAQTFDPYRAQLTTWFVLKIESEMHAVCRSQARHWGEDPDRREIVHGLTPVTAPPPNDSTHRERLYEWTAWGRRGNAVAMCENWTALDVTADELREQIAESDVDDLRGLRQRLILRLRDGNLQQAAREERISYWRALRVLKKVIKDS